MSYRISSNILVLFKVHRRTASSRNLAYDRRRMRLRYEKEETNAFRAKPSASSPFQSGPRFPGLNSGAGNLRDVFAFGAHPAVAARAAEESDAPPRFRSCSSQCMTRSFAGGALGCGFGFGASRQRRGTRCELPNAHADCAAAQRQRGSKAGSDAPARNLFKRGCRPAD